MVLYGLIMFRSLIIIETKLKFINLYPNPVNNGLLNVSSNENIDELQIFDVSGKMVHQELNLGTNAEVLGTIGVDLGYRPF